MLHSSSKVPPILQLTEMKMTMVTIALIVWASFILVATFFGSIKVNGHEVRAIPGRFLTATFAVPFLGFICWMLGFIGDFLLSPIFALFH